MHKGVDPLENYKLRKESVCMRERVEEDDDNLLSEVMKMQIGWGLSVACIQVVTTTSALLVPPTDAL